MAPLQVEGARTKKYLCHGQIDIDTADSSL